MIIVWFLACVLCRLTWEGASEEDLQQFSFCLMIVFAILMFKEMMNGFKNESG